MKQLFLTSNAREVIPDIVAKIGNPVNGMKTAFINTAAEAEEGDKAWLVDDRDALSTAGFEVFDYSVTDKKEEELRRDLQDVAVLFVAGGNSFYLLEKMIKSGFINLAKEFVSQGKIYIGSSAGSVVAGPDVYPVISLDAVEKTEDLRSYTGLCLVDFVVLPHWGVEEYKDAYTNSCVFDVYNEKNKIILLTNNQYVHVKDDWYRIEEIKS